MRRAESYVKIPHILTSVEYLRKVKKFPLHKGYTEVLSDITAKQSLKKETICSSDSTYRLFWVQMNDVSCLQFIILKINRVLL